MHVFLENCNVSIYYSEVRLPLRLQPPARLPVIFASEIEPYATILWRLTRLIMDRHFQDRLMRERFI